MDKLTDKEAEILIKGRKEAQASLACDGLYLTDEEIRIFEFMEQERMTPEQRIAYLKETFFKRYPNYLNSKKK